MHTRKLRLYQDEIRPEMLDYNGHVTEGGMCSLRLASDALYEKLGMDARWRLATVAPLYGGVPRPLPSRAALGDH